MKDINVIHLDLEEVKLLPTHYNIGFTHYSPTTHVLEHLDGMISFAGSLIEYKDETIINQWIPIPLLKQLLVLLTNEYIDYSLYSQTVAFSKTPCRHSLMTLELNQFDFERYEIYCVSFNIEKQKSDFVFKQLENNFNLRILNETGDTYEVYLHLKTKDISNSVDMLKHYLE